MENKKRNKPRKGRPAKEKAKLSTSINLKLTESDFNLVREKAEKLGIKATQYVREIVLKGKVINRFSLEELALVRKLTGMANNLNQIAKQANTSGFSLVSIEVAHIAVQIKDLVNDR